LSSDVYFIDRTGRAKNRKYFTKLIILGSAGTIPFKPRRITASSKLEINQWLKVFKESLKMVSQKGMSELCLNPKASCPIK